MEIPEIYILLVSVIASIFSIASTSIGIQSFNSDPIFKEKYHNNFIFLIINLVVSIIVLLLAFVALFLKFRH